jgi:hypothetical protein
MYACTFIEIYTRRVYYEGFILEVVGSTLVVRMWKGPVKILRNTGVFEHTAIY